VTVIPRQTTVIRAGDTVYVRTGWNSASDYVQSLTLNLVNPAPYSNNNLNFLSSGLIPIATTDASVSTTSLSTVFQIETDDATPIWANATYLGANHGAYFVLETTVPDHGKATVDIGSVWSDGVQHWTILRVKDANTLWLLADNVGTPTHWNFPVNLATSNLTHISGATNTAPMTVASSFLQELSPGIRGQSKTLVCDGQTPITADGVYQCEFLDVTHSYEIMDVPSILAFVKAHVGSPNPPAFDDPSIASMYSVSMTYRFAQSGAVTVTGTNKPNQDVYGLSTGFVQATALNVPTGGTIYEYLPKTEPVVAGGNTYDFANVQDITNRSDTVNVLTASWLSPADPPDRFLQLTKDNTGTPVFGFEIGYNPNTGMGAATLREANIWNAFTWFGPTKKQYPILYSPAANPTPAGTIINAVAFRCPINYSLYPSATAVCWYQVNNDYYLNLDFHANFTGNLSLSSFMVGRQVQVVDSGGTFSLNSKSVTTDGVNVTVDNNFGYAVLRLF
jgi:hypothetical protein